MQGGWNNQKAESDSISPYSYRDLNKSVMFLENWAAVTLYITSAKKEWFQCTWRALSLWKAKELPVFFETMYLSIPICKTDRKQHSAQCLAIYVCEIQSPTIKYSLYHFLREELSSQVLSSLLLSSSASLIWGHLTSL